MGEILPQGEEILYDSFYIFSGEEILQRSFSGGKEYKGEEILYDTGLDCHVFCFIQF